MTSQVFYRKWRPQTLTEVAGQDHVTQTLLHALQSGRIAHAYLLCGPRGTGKTSTGRILAKAVNCLNSGIGEPCNSCDMCQEVTQGRAMDIIEIDAASNRGIDEIRELRERVNFSPSRARYKVYIIDEVHMLTEPASNALLKTLEEPPPHAIFILATTEPHKMLPTILSRCQRFDFRRLSHDAVISKLLHICEREGISVELQALKLIAKSVSGSLRDAENLLQQLVTYYGNQIDVHQAEELLGVTNDFRVRELAGNIADKNLAAGLATINSLLIDGIDLSQFHRALVEYLREILLAKCGAEETLALTGDDLVQVKEMAGRISMEDIIKAIKLFGQIDLRSGDYSPLPMELALVEIMLPHTEKAVLPAVDISPGSFDSEASSVKPEPVSKKAVVPAANSQSGSPDSKVSAPKIEPVAEEAEVTYEPGLEYIRTQWDEFVETLRGMGSSGNLDAFLRSACEPVAVEDDTLVLAFYYSFHKEKIEDSKYRHLIEKKLSDKFGCPSKVRCILKPKARQRAVEGHLVKAALEMGGRVTSVEEK